MNAYAPIVCMSSHHDAPAVTYQIERLRDCIGDTAASITVVHA